MYLTKRLAFFSLQATAVDRCETSSTVKLLHNLQGISFQTVKNNLALLRIFRFLFLLIFLILRVHEIGTFMQHQKNKLGINS